MTNHESPAMPLQKIRVSPSSLPKYKLVLITYFALAPTVVLFQLLLGWIFKEIPQPFTIIASGPFIVFLMIYVSMPLTKRLLRRWL